MSDLSAAATEFVPPTAATNTVPRWTIKGREEEEEQEQKEEERQRW